MELKDIKSPDDIKGLSLEELDELAASLREVIIERVSLNGGHLASNLGVIELTLALHRVFDTPRDKIIWDVGHQSYTHKILTGRLGRFDTLRQYEGISGFPNRDESPHDAFGTGHSSTSISSATGILEARDKKGEDYKVIAVIGDGSMTAGLAFEGLNHAGGLKKDLIVILNDNEMSISKNVGALSAYLTRILTGELYRKFKKNTQSLLESIPKFGEQFSKFAQRTEEGLKGLFLPGVLFEEMGFNYIGPIDGHDIGLLSDTLQKVKTATTPTLMHVITKKGKGYEFSEKDPCVFHGVGKFEIETGYPVTNGATSSLSYSELFGQTLTELADEDEQIIAISAAMKEGTGLTCFAESHPDRFYDVGIAEPHATTFAAGLASEGLKPVVAIYSTFLQRAYDEIIHDVCIQRLPVVFAIDRAGIVGEDGVTHQGSFDLSYLRHIPNLTVMSPKDAPEFRAMLALSLRLGKPVAVRYPRGKAEDMGFPAVPFEEGEGEILREGPDVAVLALGSTVQAALNAAGLLENEGVKATVVNMRFVKPLDEELILSVASRVKKIITVEDNAAAGGFGSAILEFLNSKEVRDVRVKVLGLPDKFIEHGATAILRKKYGIDAEGVFTTALRMVKEEVKRY